MKKIVQLGLGLIVSWSATFIVQQASAHSHDIASKVAPQISFIENKGQWNQEARYKANIPGGAVFLTDKGFVYTYYKASDLERIHNLTCKNGNYEDVDVDNEVINMHAYRVNFVGANKSIAYAPSQKRTTYHNYYIGNNPSEWASNVGLFGGVTQRNVFDGIDMKVYSSSDGKGLKYDFIVAPNADVSQIKLSFQGVKPQLLANGDLRIKTSVNEIIEQAPYTYQEIAGKRIEVKSRYVLKDGVLSFEFPEGYQKNHKLIVDPNLIFATYSGGNSGTNYANSAAFDDDGNTYAGGLAYGAGWPVTTGAYQVTYAASFAGCINKYSTDGVDLLYSTFFGGNASGTGKPMPNAMRTDALGNLYVTGSVSTASMPVTPGAYQPTMNGSSDIFIAKFNPTGTTLLASTFLGGSGIESSLRGNTTVYAGNTDQGNPVNPVEIAFDQDGNVWVTSNSGSLNYPVTANAIQATNAGSHDAVISKLDANLTTLIYSSYIGGSGWDGGIGIEYNANNNTVGVVGYTASANFPTTSGAYHTTAPGGIDGFALLINNASYQLIASTYLGTSAADFAMRLAFDCGNNFFVAGRTQGNYPVTNTTAEGLVPTGYVFIDKLSPDLSTSIASTRTGANNTSIVPSAMMVDLCGNILVATITNNSHQIGMPVTPDAFQTASRGFYFAGFEPNFAGLAFGSYYGSSANSDHYHPGVARIDPKGIIYQTVCYAGSNGTWVTSPPNVYAPNKLNGSTNDIVTFKFDFEVLGLDATSESGYAGYGSIPHAVRGCKSAYIHYSRNGDTTVPMVLRFNILSGTTPDMAVNGVDYQFVADSLVFNAYERTKALEIKPLLVPNMPTGSKMVVIESLNPCGCNGGSGEPIRRDTVYIHDSIRAEIEEPLPAYCPGTQISITAQVDPGLDYEWSPAEFNNGSLTINPILHTSRTFSIKVTQQGAPPTCPPVIKEFHALVEQFPVIGMSADTTVCILDSISIPVVVSPDSVNYLYNWSPSTGLRANNLQTNFFKMPPGTYNYLVTVTTPLANCTSTHNITINVRPPFKLYNLQPEYGATVDYLSEVNMSAEGAEIYKWSPVELFVDPTLQNPTTLPLKESGYFYVTGIDQYGCKDTAEIFVNVRYPYEPIMPNAFSPNKDGRNDIFRIPNGEYQKIHRFEVYNRWGKRVFSTTDPNIGWDGTDENNGKDCDQGVYVYIITIELPNKEIRTYKGDVTLIR